MEIQTQYISRLHKYNVRVPTCYFDIKGKYSTFSKGNLSKDFCLDYSKWPINRIKSKLISLEIGFKLLSALNWLSKNFHRKIIILKMKQRTIPLEVRQLRKIFQLKASKTWLLFTFQLNFWIIDVKAKYRLLSRVYK